MTCHTPELSQIFYNQENFKSSLRQMGMVLSMVHKQKKKHGWHKGKHLDLPFIRTL